MNMCKSSKRKTVPELCLQGQVFFIWSTYQSLEIVKDRISLLGGKVDPFLSRDVTTVLVEDNHLVGSQASSTHLQTKPSYVGSQVSAPHLQAKPLYVGSPASAAHLQTKPSYAASGTVVTSFPYQSVPSTSRGVLACSSASPYRVICYALQWGIRVLGIDQFLTWIEPQVKTAITLKKKPVPESISRLSGCFIKFESSLKNYRPCYKMFGGDPDRLLPLKNANVLVKAENCSIVLDQPGVARQIHFKQVSVVVPAAKNVVLPIKANERKVPNNKLKPKDENNYCECCRTHFADLKSHIKSVKHQNFVSNEKNYEIVQNIIKMLPTAQEFINKLQNSSPEPGQVDRNAEIPQSMAVTSGNAALNMQLIHENLTMPMDLHVEKEKPQPAVVVDKDENCLPLDLVKRISNVKNEIKPGESLLNHLEENNPSQKLAFGLSAIQGDAKTSLVSIKVEEPDQSIPCDVVNGDPLATTAALAQLCLKNFDSYFLDNLPCEMDDMVFEDIFDLDDGKPKLEIDNEPVEVQFLASDMVQTPGLVSGISTPSFKTPTNTNMSFCMNSSLDLKDAKSESTNVLSTPCKPEKGLNDVPSQNMTESANVLSFSCKLDKGLNDMSSQNVVDSASILSTSYKPEKGLNSMSLQNVTESTNVLSFSCKLEKGLNNVSSQNVTESANILPTSCKPEKDLNDVLSQSVTQQSLDPKKKIFSIATYCANKVEACSSKVDPSCSNANAELLFSSDTSDSENEHVLISNVLSFINNNSDSELSRKSANQNASCSKGFPFSAKCGTNDCSPTIPDQGKTHTEVDSLGKRQSSAHLDYSDASQVVPAKKLCSSMDHLRTINFSAVDLVSSKTQVTFSDVDMASSKTHGASSAVDLASRKNQVASSAVHLASSKTHVPSSASDLASNKNQVALSVVDLASSKNQAASSAVVSTSSKNQAASAVDLASSKNQAASSAVDSTSSKNQAASSAVDSSTSSKNQAASSAVDLASSKNQVTSCKNVSNNQVQMPTEPSVSFAKMKMKISPKDVHEGKDPAQKNSNDCDSNQNYIHSKMAFSKSSSLVNNNACLSNSAPYNHALLQETVIQQNIPLNLKAPEQKRDLCKSVKPKRDFSIAHLTNDLEVKREHPCSLSKQTELCSPQTSSWDFATKPHIPSKNLDANYQNHQAKASLHQPFVDASPVQKTGCEALSVLPKKAFRRKYVLPKDDQKQLNDKKTIISPINESQGERKRSPCSDLKCLSEHDEKSRLLAANETGCCDQNDKNGTYKDKILPGPTSIKSELSREVSMKASVTHEEISFEEHCSEVKDQEKSKLSLVSVGKRDSLKAFTIPKVVPSEAVSSLHPVAESSSSNSTRILHRTKLPKLLVLPSHWTVSVVPGSGVKLKFTRVHPPKLENQFEATKR